jgi:alcohol dehydrogenase class IV
MELAFNNLRKVYNNGQDVEARMNMSLASLMAGIAFTNAGLGAVHAMSFPLGGKFHAPHGVAIAALLPSVMKFNAKGDPETFKNIAKLIGENIEGLSNGEAALKAVNAVKKLCKDVNIPNISTFGVTENDLPQMAADTMKIERLLAGNPCKVTEEDVLLIFKDAISS